MNQKDAFRNFFCTQLVASDRKPPPDLPTPPPRVNVLGDDTLTFAEWCALQLADEGTRAPSPPVERVVPPLPEEGRTDPALVVRALNPWALRRPIDEPESPKHWPMGGSAA